MRIAFSSSVERSCIAQVGSTTAGFKKPMAVGTCKRPDWRSSTDLIAWNVCKVVRKTGSRVAASIAGQLARSFLNCQRPTPTLSRATLAPTAQITNRHSAHETGTVIAELAVLAELALEAAPPNTGSTEIASNAEN